MLLRGAIATAKYVAKRLSEDFGFGRELVDVGRIQDIVMHSVLMPHATGQTEDGALKISVFNCPFAPMAILISDPVACEICVGYVRGATDYVTGNKGGVSRVAHIPAGDEKCDFIIRYEVPHGLSQYNFKAPPPTQEYLSTLLIKNLEFVKREYLPKALSNPKIVGQGADEETSKSRALGYLIETMSLVLRGLVMTEAHTAYTLLGKGLSYRILEKTGREAARYMLSGFPPVISGWNERFNLSSTEGRAEKAVVLYSTVMKLDGKVGDGWFEVTNCLWKNMLDETLKDPLNYGMTRLSKSEEAEAIKCGCASCDSCLKELVGSNGVHAEQVSCKADGEAKCRWVFR